MFDTNLFSADSTGIESVFVEYDNKEIMFHVSTLLPYSEADTQKVFIFILFFLWFYLFILKKIERKRHLGNDIVVIIYMDGKTKFPTGICKSVFNR